MRRLLETLFGIAMLGTMVMAQGSDSSRAAKDLVQVLQARHLDAIAVADPRTPGRYLAALFIAPSQLLVVRAGHANPDALNAAIRERRYRDVYVDLQTSPTVQDKLFVHDLGADGLVPSGKTVIDNVYENGVRAELTASGPASTRMRTVDAEYARMLRTLTDAVNESPATTSQVAVSEPAKE